MVEGGISKLVDRCLNHLLPERLFISKQIEDIKGFDRKPLEGEEIPLNGRGGVEELIYVAGKIREVDEETKEDLESQDSTEMPVEPFALTLITSFKSFKGYGHIIHDVSLSRCTDSQQPIDLRTIGCSPNIELCHFRTGMELFRSRYAGRFGIAPIADQRFSIEATPSDFKLSIVAESLKNRQELPLSKDGYFERLSTLFHEFIGFDLKADYHRLADPTTDSRGQCKFPARPIIGKSEDQKLSL
jgi:hypothetical protein